MSTQNPGSPDGTPETSTPTGLIELVQLQRALFDLASILSDLRSHILSAEQTVQSLASSVEDLRTRMDQSTSTPEASTSDGSSSTTPLKRSESSSYVKGQWMPSRSGEWVYTHSPSTDLESLTHSKPLWTAVIPTTSSLPSTTMTPVFRLIGKPSGASLTDWLAGLPGRTPGART